jgi:integrase
MRRRVWEYKGIVIVPGLFQNSSLLQKHEVDIKVQQALLGHADIRTTMNIYPQAVPTAVREANRKVVKNILGKQGGIEAALRVPEATKSFQISTSPTS